MPAQDTSVPPFSTYRIQQIPHIPYQPYENELENRIYGLTENKKYKVFCDKTDLIKIGRYAKFGDEFFEIIKAECWNFGMTAMMRSEKNAD